MGVSGTHLRLHSLPTGRARASMSLSNSPSLCLPGVGVGVGGVNAAVARELFDYYPLES